MKIALLLCDVPTLGLQEEFGRYQNMFVALVKPDDQLDIFPICVEVSDDESVTPPKITFPNINDYDGFIVSGSKKAVYEEHHWLDPLFSFIREISATDKKLVGVCFGHQAIAYALGGSVSKSKKGWGIGHYSNEWYESSNQPPMVQAGQSLHLLSFHQDQVDKLPTGFDILAGSEFTPYFVTKYKNQILTTQGHPEMSAKYIEALSHILEPALGKDIAKSGRQSLLGQDDSVFFREFICEFWEL